MSSAPHERTKQELEHLAIVIMSLDATAHSYVILPARSDDKLCWNDIRAMATALLPSIPDKRKPAKRGAK